MTLGGAATLEALVPVVYADTRLLILGSLPGEASLKAGQYYAHPQNGFWRLIGGVIGHPDLAGQPYAERLSILNAHGIGLWDVSATVFGVPLLPVALFSIWALLIVALAWLVERRAPGEEGE